MLKSLFPQVDWGEIRAVGFDLDGTLYDEFEFIAQVYRPIATLLAKACSVAPERIYDAIVARWLEKGSSYNRIFDEVLSEHGITDSEKAQVVAACLDTFRGFVPELALPARTAAILELIAADRELFLVTDGSVQLQGAKIKALGLERWFSPEVIVISGASGLSKPSPELLPLIPALRDGMNPNRVLYLGDREIDRSFAANGNFRFQRVFCLAPTN